MLLCSCLCVCVCVQTGVWRGCGPAVGLDRASSSTFWQVLYLLTHPLFQCVSLSYCPYPFKQNSITIGGTAPPFSSVVLCLALSLIPSSMSLSACRCSFKLSYHAVKREEVLLLAQSAKETAVSCRETEKFSTKRIWTVQQVHTLRNCTFRQCKSNRFINSLMLINVIGGNDIRKNGNHNCQYMTQICKCCKCNEAYQKGPYKDWWHWIESLAGCSADVLQVLSIASWLLICLLKD